MRIGPPPDVIKAYVRPVAADPLPPEVSSKLIASGVFTHDPRKVLWAAPGQSQGQLGSTIHSSAPVDLPGGIRFHAYGAPQSNDSLLGTLLDTGRQSLPVLEESQADVLADGVALLVATPDIFHALTGPDRGNAENVFRYATSLVRLLKIANTIAHVPHADESLQVVATIFKVGEQVFISQENNLAG